jgi:hypothetical protein
MIGSFAILASRKIMLRIFQGLTFSVSQSVEHPLRRFPADLSVRSHVPHRVSSLLEFGEDLGDESMPAFGRRLGFSLLALDIYPEFQLFRHPQFHFFPIHWDVLSCFKLASRDTVASGARQV